MRVRVPLRVLKTARGRAVVACKAHNLEVAGSNPALAPNNLFQLMIYINISDENLSYVSVNIKKLLTHD